MAISIGNMVMDQWIPSSWAQVMKIRELTAAGASQLAVDLEYLRKAMISTVGQSGGDRWKKQFGILGNGSVSKPIVPLLFTSK